MDANDEAVYRAFLHAIETGTGQEALTARHIFADWLEDRGLDSEAHEQRSWTLQRQEAKDWLVDFAKRCGKHCENYDEVTDSYYAKTRDLGWNNPEHERLREEASEELERDEHWVDITYDMVMEAARRWLESGTEANAWYERIKFIQQGEEGARNLMSNQEVREKFWECYMLVTGQNVPEEERGVVFSCSC